MIEWYVKTRQLLKNLNSKAQDALPLYQQGGKEASAPINGYIKTDLLKQLREHWLARYAQDEHLFRDLGRHIGFGMDGDYCDIVKNDIPELAERADSLLLADSRNQRFGFEELLHPAITKSSYDLYRNGHLREAVLNSITALFDVIRGRTNSPEDGERLIGRAFSIENPLLIFSELETESGQNDQKGFMQILKGAYQGIRNPKAHSMTHDLTQLKAAQYLVLASLLARRVDEAKPASSLAARSSRASAANPNPSPVQRDRREQS